MSACRVEGLIPVRYVGSMDQVREISVGASDALAGEISAAVAAGDYASQSDVVGEALELWRGGRDAEVQRLRALWGRGLRAASRARSRARCWTASLPTAAPERSRAAID